MTITREITREQALDVLLGDLNPNTRALVETILEAAPDSRTPPDLAQRMDEMANAHQNALAVLRTAVVGGACSWIDEVQKMGCGEEEAFRFAAVSLEWGAAMLVRRLHQKLGKPFSAGRFALVACDQANAALKFPMGMLDTAEADANAMADAAETAA
jgi:hypothetical protein